ncbi:hypothetical protein K501DRAFT_91020 [Backusella circina FSU 941]|nr:hypothetical protein K501DRAFT_91020 [Backusella circina FSU 941]
MEPLALLSIIEELSRMRYEEVWRNRNRQAIRDFWINKLDNRQRLEIIRSEELFLFIKLGEIQNKECECVICDNKRQQLKTDIHLTYKHYLRDLKQFDDQEKSIIACQVLLNTETSRLQMTVNIETKEMFINREENKDTHRQEYYTQISSVFCLFAARMLDRRIIKTYDEALALERQVKLIEEEEQERQRITERKQRKSEHRKDMLNKKRLIKNTVFIKKKKKGV